MSVKKILNKINVFYKIAGLTLTDDLANHIYVNTILQKLPKDQWPEVYVNYGIEGADNAIKYGVKVLLSRLDDPSEYDFARKLQNNDYDINAILQLKQSLIYNGYNQDYRKPWIITIDRLIDLIKAKNELSNAIKNKKDPKFIFDKKVEVNIALNMFYDSAHSDGSILEHLASEETSELKENKIKLVVEKINKLYDIYYKYLRSTDRKLYELRGKHTPESNRLIKKLEENISKYKQRHLSKIEELGTLKDDIARDTINSEGDLLKLLDASRLSDSSDVISLISPYIENPKKYDAQQEYTSFSPQKPDRNRINSDLMSLKLRGIATNTISNLKSRYELFNKNTNDFDFIEDIKDIDDIEDEKNIYKNLHRINDLAGNIITDLNNFITKSVYITKKYKINNDKLNELIELKNSMIDFRKNSKILSSYDSNEKNSLNNITYFIKYFLENTLKAIDFISSI